MVERTSLTAPIVLLLTLFASFVDASTESGAKPNVLFLLCDDYGILDVGIEGSRFYETPSIDALAEKSVRFTQGYATCSVCSPSRASILLGQFAARHGITNWIGSAEGEANARNRRRPLLTPDYVANLPTDQTTLAEAFQEAGYATFFAGKWHLGTRGSWPEDHGFDVNKGGWDSGSPRGGYFAPWQNPNLPSGPPGEPLPQRLANEAAAFINASRDRPFVAYVSFYSVHGPLQTSESLWRKYQGKAARLGTPSERFAIDGVLPVRRVQDHPVYAGMVEAMDDAVGTILRALEESGEADNTIVCFTSDNGGVVSGDAFSSSMVPYRGGKGRQWEGGTRAPFYIHVPWLPRRQATCDVPVTGADFYPTLLDLAGLPLRPRQHVDGVSLVSCLQGEGMAERPLFWHYPHYSNQAGDPSSTLRRGDWKLIHYWEDGHAELYRLSDDRGEENDLADQYPDRTRQMAGELRAWLRDVGAKEPTAWPGYEEGMALQHRKQAKKRKESLEKSHARFLEPNWTPNATWWNSQAVRD